MPASNLSCLSALCLPDAGIPGGHCHARHISQAIGVLFKAPCIHLPICLLAISLYQFRVCKPHIKVCGPFWIELTFIQVQRSRSVFILLHVDTHVPRHQERTKRFMGSHVTLVQSQGDLSHFDFRTCAAEAGFLGRVQLVNIYIWVLETGFLCV